MRTRLLIVFWLLLGLTTACARGQNGASSLIANLNITPSTVGENHVRIELFDGANTHVVGADVKMIANMNHAGMQPSSAPLTETAPGIYEGTIELTMPGEWFAILEITREDGQTVELQVALPEVRRGE